MTSTPTIRPIRREARHAGTLSVIRAARLRDLLRDCGMTRFEASGIAVADDGRFLVVFDDIPDVARIHPSLEPAHPGTDLVPRLAGSRQQPGYEDIAVGHGRVFALVESAAHPDGRDRGWIVELDTDLRPLRWSAVDVPVARPNKGLEGLCWVSRQGRNHLLALHEPAASGGRIDVLAEDASGSWHPVAEMRLPGSAALGDHSGIAVLGRRVAVTSQESGAVWVGALAEDAWALVGPGTVHRLPRTRRARYDALEGVAWLDPQTLVLVSDRSKHRRSARRRRTEESVHVVRLPEGRDRTARRYVSSGDPRPPDRRTGHRSRPGGACHDRHS